MQRASDEKFLALARERFQLAAEAEAEIREKSLEDLRFRAGEQWPDQIRNNRTLDGRPCLTINRMPQFIRQVTNEQRQNRPAIEISPVGDGADVETAEIIQGLVRNIEVRSDGEVAYDCAGESSTTIGFGYFRIITDFVDPTSFDQEIRIERILNPFTVYFDPSCQKPDYSDANWAFIVTEMGEREYREAYPDSELASLTEFTSIGDRAPTWVGKDGSGNWSIRIAEYFYVEKTKKKLVLLTTGKTKFEDEIEEGIDEIALGPDGKPVTRDTEVRAVKWAKINAVEKLEETDWLCEWIPIIPTLGDEFYLENKRYLTGMVRDARDPQRMYNYWNTAMTETIALAPRAPHIGAEGQFEGHEKEWRQANVRNIPYLEYKPKSVGQELVPPPQRQQYEPPVQAIAAALVHADNDLKATMGIYDASLGAPGPERSGKAILARQQEGNTANMHYLDNLKRSIRHAGRIIVALIPKIYNKAQVVKIITPDLDTKLVQINQRFDEGGIEKLYDLTTGKYDVTVSVGPAVQTRRQEAVEALIELIKANPALAQIVSDVLVRNMDWPGAKEIADRLKKLLPPQLQDQPEGTEEAIPPAVQAKLNALMEQHQQLVGEINRLIEERNTKAMELASRERIEAAKISAQLVITEAKIHAENAQAALMAEVQAIGRRLDALHESELAPMPAVSPELAGTAGAPAAPAPGATQ